MGLHTIYEYWNNRIMCGDKCKIIPSENPACMIQYDMPIHQTC